MRFIMREQTYERPLASGHLRYSTGASEQWRLTAAVDGYTFLRVDLDARASASGDSYLYHLTLDPNGRLQRLQYRFWGQGLQVKGSLLFEEETLTNGRHVNDQEWSESLPAAPFWFPATTGLKFLAPLTGEEATAVTLATDFSQPAHAFRLQAVTVRVSTEPEESLLVGQQKHVGRPFTIRWGDQSRTVWLTAEGWPLQMHRGDGIVATADQLITAQSLPVFLCPTDEAAFWSHHSHADDEAPTPSNSLETTRSKP